ncbi:MAG: IS630 family transposase [Gemmataceae bacterium]|nr:IS630 family transposase [Gemmataceae bacterium]
MRAYSTDLRDRVLADCDDGMATAAAAAKYRVSASWVRRVKQRRVATGETAPRAGGRGPKPSLGGTPTDPGRRSPPAGGRSQKVGPRGRAGPPSGSPARAAWRAGQPALDPGRVVFPDETGATTTVTRTRGRCPRGERLACPVPHGHWKTTAFVAVLRSDRLTAPVVIDGAMTGDLFVAHVRQIRVPELRPGDVVVMDNLRCHKRVEAARAIAAAGAEVRFLPPYSPDLNPIENAFSTLEGMLGAAERRVVEGRWSFLGEALDAFAPAECRNDHRHCGYVGTPTSKPLEAASRSSLSPSARSHRRSASNPSSTAVRWSARVVKVRAGRSCFDLLEHRLDADHLRRVRPEVVQADIQRRPPRPGGLHDLARVEAGVVEHHHPRHARRWNTAP